MRQNRTKKAGIATLEHPEGRVEVPDIPNPDARVWHPLTVVAWQHAWESPMASQWLKTDVDAMGRLAVLWDGFYNGAAMLMSEIRLQEQRFGLSPLDRSRLQWEVSRGEEAEKRRQPKEQPKAIADPRKILQMVG